MMGLFIVAPVDNGNQMIKLMQGIILIDPIWQHAGERIMSILSAENAIVLKRAMQQAIQYLCSKDMGILE
jgi:hypothetical protein